jgi:hypothetical protein
MLARTLQLHGVHGSHMRMYGSTCDGRSALVTSARGHLRHGSMFSPGLFVGASVLLDAIG